VNTLHSHFLWTRYVGVLLISSTHPYVSLPRVDSAPTTTVLRFMSLETGGVHPLAKAPDLQLDTTLPVSLLDVRADVIGDQIILVLVDLRNEAPESDAIYLVDWKEGLMTLVRSVIARPHSDFISNVRSTARQMGLTRARSPFSPRNSCSS